MTRKFTTLSALPFLALITACSQGDKEEGLLDEAPETQVSEVESNEIPEAIRAAAEAKIEGMVIAEVERKERDGMVFYDVEGSRPDGSEVELDMLEENGVYTVVEVQRDIDWADAPKAAASAAPDGLFAPVRVIESIQNDGTIIYELFEDGKPKAPSAEISFKDGKAEMLTERWKY